VPRRPHPRGMPYPVAGLSLIPYGASLDRIRELVQVEPAAAPARGVGQGSGVARRLERRTLRARPRRGWLPGLDRRHGRTAPKPRGVRSAGGYIQAGEPLAGPPEWWAETLIGLRRRRLRHARVLAHRPLAWSSRALLGRGRADAPQIPRPVEENHRTTDSLRSRRACASRSPSSSQRLQQGSRVVAAAVHDSVDEQGGRTPYLT
jgi:hypothetical protein